MVQVYHEVMYCHAHAFDVDKNLPNRYYEPPERYSKKGYMKRIIALLLAATPCILPFAIDMGSNQYRFAAAADTVSGAPASYTSIRNAVSGALRKANFGVTTLDFNTLSDESVLSISNFSAVIITAPYFPNTASNAFARFLESGGDLLVVGGRPFAQTVYAYGGAWRTADDICERAASHTVLRCDSADGWRTDSDDAVDTAISAEGVSRKFITARIDLRSRWNIITSAASVVPGANVLSLTVKADAKTPMIVVVAVTRDGGRWYAPLAVSTNWQRRFVTASMFRRYPPVPGERFALSNAARIGAGFYADIIRYAHGPHEICLDDIAARTVPEAVAAGERFSLTDIFIDGDAYAFSNAAAAVPWTNYEPMIRIPSIPVRHSGVSAVGIAFPGVSMTMPLLASMDDNGRRIGIAGGMVVRFTGRSNCITSFGVDSEDFYRAAAFTELITNAAHLTAATGLHAVAAERLARMKAVRHIDASAPTRLRLGRSGFTNADGRRVFMVGVNYSGSFDSRSWKDVSPALIEEDFKRMADAGINTARLYGTASLFADRTKFDVLAACARTYGVALIPVLVANTSEHYDRAVLTNRIRRAAEICRDEPSVIAVDLQNEPYPAELAKITNGGKPLADLAPHADGWKSYVDRTMLGERTFRDAVLPLPPRFDARAERAFAAYNTMFDAWLSWQIKAIRAVDASMPITVGYDSFHALLPANNALNLVSYHADEAPLSLNDIKASLTVLDRLRKQFPGKQIMLGEIGYSTAAIINGRTLDDDAAAVAEFTHYLYAFANGYAGVMKWCLNDWPPALAERYAGWVPEERTRFNEHARMGMYRYLTPLAAEPRPIVYCTRALRSFIDAGGIGGTLTLRPSRAVTGTGYVYSNTNALFIGDTDYADARVSFSTGDDRPVNLFMRWDDRTLTMAASRDVAIQCAAAANGQFTVPRDALDAARPGMIILRAGRLVELTAKAR